MNKYTDLEMSIISCFLQQPDLIKKIEGKEDYFIHYKKILLFLKAIYNKFGCFDINIMHEACKNKQTLYDYLAIIFEYSPIPSHIDIYISQLEELRTELKKDKWIREKVYSLSSELYIKNITFEDFKNKLNKLEEDAEKLFNENNM